MSSGDNTVPIVAGVLIGVGLLALLYKLYGSQPEPQLQAARKPCYPKPSKEPVKIRFNSGSLRFPSSDDCDEDKKGH